MKGKEIISVKDSADIGVPLSYCTKYENLLFLAGQVSKDLKTGNIKTGTVGQETEQVIKNLDIVLKEAGSSLDCVLKTTVFLTKKEDFSQMNEIYKKYFPRNPPARSAIVINLAGDFKIEIEAIAYVPAIPD